MAAGNKQVKIDAYTLSHYIVGGIEQIHMTCTQSGGSVLGVIKFYPTGITRPISMVTSGGQFYINCDMGRFSEIITTFRYEKPIVVEVFWDANNYITTARILTSVEPVGEQEAV